MFTKNPINGADERVIEAAWGLGEAVVAGRVIRTIPAGSLGRGARAQARRKEDRDRSCRDGGTREEVQAELVEKPCLDDAGLASLSSLADRCEQVYGAAATSSGRSRARPPPVQGGCGQGPDAMPAVDVLRRVPLFADLSRREVEKIARLFKERRFAEGETVVGRAPAAPPSS